MVTKEQYVAEVVAKVKELVIKEELEAAGYDYAVAIATTAEIKAGAACGQLAILNS